MLAVTAVTQGMCAPTELAPTLTCVTAAINAIAGALFKGEDDIVRELLRAGAD